MTERITATVPQFCRLSGLGKTKVFGLIKNGTLESIKLGQSRLIVLASYRRLIEAGSKDGYDDGLGSLSKRQSTDLIEKY